MKILISKDRVFELTADDIEKIKGQMLCDAAANRHLIISHDKHNHLKAIYRILEIDTMVSIETREKYHKLIIDILSAPHSVEAEVPFQELNALPVSIIENRKLTGAIAPAAQ